MAINVSIQRTFPGFGVSTLSSIQQATGIAITSGTAYYVPGTTSNSVAGLLVPTITVGRVRVKIYNGAGTSPTLTKLQISITDGTNTVIVEDRNFGTAVTLSSTNFYDGVFNFLIDYSTAGGGATGTLLAPTVSTTAMVVNVTPTLGGTSPAATMDIEVYGEP